MDNYKTCSDCKQTFPRTDEYFPIEKRHSDGLLNYCRVCSRIRRKNYRQSNPEIIAAEKKRSHERNRAKDLARSKRWREKDIEHSRQMCRDSYYAKREEYIASAMVHTVKRMARKRSLPDTFTVEQANQCLTYWHDSCAVCGRKRGLWNTIAYDHWIPLASSICPGTIATNIIPLCHGLDGCNNSKGDRDPGEWLTDRFGLRKAKSIIKRIETYFAQIEN